VFGLDGGVALSSLRIFVEVDPATDCLRDFLSNDLGVFGHALNDSEGLEKFDH